MIVFSLRCARDHDFEAWFRNGATYEAQQANGEVSCPFCGDTAIRKAPMAPNIATSRSKESRDPAIQAEPPKLEGAAAEMMAELRKAVTELRDNIEKNCDYVGKRFPEEARRIHYGESQARPIYGEASAEEAKALTEEGVDVTLIPWLPRDN